MTNTNQPTVHLQSVGKVPAKPAGELQIGDRTMWNFGHVEVVEGVTLRGQSAYVTFKSCKTGETYTRTFRQTRLVGLEPQPRAKSATIPPAKPPAKPQSNIEIDYSAAALYNITPYGNFGAEVQVNGVAKVFNEFALFAANFRQAVRWAEINTPQLDYINVYGPEGIYPRDSQIFEPVKVEFYTYSMLNRPAGYGTCPDGRLVELDKYYLMSEAAPNYGTVTYTRKLTAQELYKWEMAPASDNAYTFAVGETVIRIETDEIGIIKEHQPRNFYMVSFEIDRDRYVHFPYRGDELKADDRPIQGCDEPPQSDDPDPSGPGKPILYLLPRNPETQAERQTKLKMLATVNDNWDRSKPVTRIPDFGIVYPLPAETIPESMSQVATSEPRISDTTDWPAFDLDYLPGVIQYDRAVADSGYHGGYRAGTMSPGRPMSSYDRLYTASEPDNHCTLCGRSIPADLTICGTCQARKDRYEDRKQSRISRLQKRADKRDRENSALRKQADHMADIMNGQPILIGHHSEKRHRRMIDKMWNKGIKSWKLSKEADNLRRRAKAAQDNRAISSDDPEALILLREKLAKLEAHQLEMKRINALVKKVLAKDKAKVAQIEADYRQALPKIEKYRSSTAEEYKKSSEARSIYTAAIRALYTSHAAELADLAGISESRAISFLTPDDLDRIGYPSYELTNNNANIRRIKQRIADLETQAKKVTESADSGDVVKLYPHNATVTQNAFENRLQIAFPGKPAPDIIKRLKQNGFHWSRNNGVWQRMLTPQAIAIVSYILGQPIEPEPPTIPGIDRDNDYIAIPGEPLYPRDTQIFEPVIPEDYALATALSNVRKHADSTVTHLAVYRHKTTGQRRIAMRSTHSPFPSLGIVITGAGDMFQSGRVSWYDVEKRGEWECVRDWVEVNPIPAEPQQLSLL